jgi:hypothetical protein
LSPWRRPVAAAYGSLVVSRALMEAVQDGPAAGVVLAGALPVMHAAWAVGFVKGITRSNR